MLHYFRTHNLQNTAQNTVGHISESGSLWGKCSVNIFPQYEGVRGS